MKWNTSFAVIALGLARLSTTFSADTEREPPAAVAKRAQEGAAASAEERVDVCGAVVGAGEECGCGMRVRAHP